jgi:hypothetical protein
MGKLNTTAPYELKVTSDTDPAIMAVEGGNISIVEGNALVEPGYTATDNADGDISVNGVVLINRMQ